MIRIVAGVIVLAVAAAAALVALAPGSSSPASCSVTLPTSKVRATFGPAGFNYGTKELRAGIWPDGKLVAGIQSDGGAMAIVNADGSIYAKQGWWRGVPGKLAISGRRMDRSAARLVGEVPDGYGRTGFTPAGLTFPSVGCWEVVGMVGRARLSFVVEVTKLD
jgi:hypothetical protein